MIAIKHWRLMYRFRNFRLFFGIHPDRLASPEKPFKPPEEALNDRIKGFELAADTYKLRFRVFQVIVIVASGIIPIINLSDIATPATRFISSILGSLIVIVTGLTQMDKNHEMWILKASVEHALKHQKLLFVNGVKPYEDPKTKESVLITKMNDIISSHLESYFNVAGENRENLTNTTT
jgi:Protein of unknown function (DUF4231)